MPGDTNKRLREALQAGIAGAVLVITPEIAMSTVVRLVELPQLRRLAKDPSFTFSIATKVTKATGELDYGAADALLRTRPGTLSKHLQRPASTPAERAEIAHAHARRRAEALRPGIAAAGGTLTIDLRTRSVPDARPTTIDFPIVVRPPASGRRVPSRAAMTDLREALGHLPQLVGVAAASSVRVTGATHLTVAFAIGAALPVTAIGVVEATDVHGQTWTVSASAGPAGLAQLDVEAHDLFGGAGPVAVFIDLVTPASAAGVEDLLATCAGQISALLTVRPAVPGRINADAASTIVGELAETIRSFATTHQTVTVHLLLRCPWPVALLLGRLCNTLLVYLYEHDSPGESGGYVPSLVVRSGAGGSPITDVLVPPD